MTSTFHYHLHSHTQQEVSRFVNSFSRVRWIHAKKKKVKISMIQTVMYFSNRHCQGEAQTGSVEQLM